MLNFLARYFILFCDMLVKNTFVDVITLFYGFDGVDKSKPWKVIARLFYIFHLFLKFMDN